MKNQKPTLAKGTRDHSPAEMAKRKYVFGIIEKIFRKYGFMPLETPAVENLNTLTGKYGEEGDRLIFKILNSGNFLNGVNQSDLEKAILTEGKSLTKQICEKALRYDLTVPLARFVVMNQHTLTWPFKRYQMQPVWRADRPQKGRYREFYQCDVDVLGSDSLIHEADLIRIYIDAFKAIGLPEIVVRINHRKLLQSIALWVAPDMIPEKFIIELDKIDKIGTEGLLQTLNLGNNQNLLQLINFLAKNTNEGSFKHVFEWINQHIPQTELLQQALTELETLNSFFDLKPNYAPFIKLDLSLARGLDYYTGVVMEVITTALDMGSLGGGGRYDNLIGIFGGNMVTGVGVSLGIERILDVLNSLDRLQNIKPADTQVLAIAMNQNCFIAADNICVMLRENGIAAELYPDYNAKLKKQLAYANAKNIRYALIIGENELEKQEYTLKNLEIGEQLTCSPQYLLQLLKQNYATYN